MTRAMPHLEGVSHRDVIADGVRLHVAEAGGESGAGAPIVLVHGWPQHWWMWRELIGPLAAHRRVICPDLRGFGWSECPDGGYDPDTFAADLLALLDVLELERVDLAGHDWGGIAGFLLAAEHPGRIHRFLALNTSHQWRRFDPREAATTGWRLWYAAAMALPFGALGLRSSVGFLERSIRAATVREECWEGSTLEAFTDQLREPDRARATMLLYRNLLLRWGPAVARGRYRHQRLAVPTLMLHGSEDFAIPASALGGWEAHADEMRLELVQGTGHYIVDERPELVLERARELFEIPAA